MMLLPAITGDECPDGSSVFQTTFVRWPKRDGRRSISATPEALGPRKLGQSPAASGSAKRSNVIEARSMYLVLFERIQGYTKTPDISPRRAQRTRRKRLGRLRVLRALCGEMFL